MAKFCTNCGKKLVEGKACDCRNNVVASNGGFDFNATFNSYVEMLKGIFVKPVDTIKKFATSDNFMLGLIAILLNCIVCGIFLYCFASEAMSSVGALFGGYGSLFGMYGVEVPFIKSVIASSELYPVTVKSP